MLTAEDSCKLLLGPHGSQRAHLSLDGCQIIFVGGEYKLRTSVLAILLKSLCEEYFKYGDLKLKGKIYSEFSRLSGRIFEPERALLWLA